MKRPANWFYRGTSCLSDNPPEYGKVYTVYENDPDYPGYITLAELDHNSVWREIDFEALVSDAVLREELESVHEPWTI